MKKGIAVSEKVRIVIAAVAAFCGVAVFAVAIAFAAIEEKAKGPTVIVASDTHVVATNTLTEELYYSYSEAEKAKHVSEAVFRTLGDDIAKRGAEFLLISGDLTEYGDEASHRAVADALRIAESRGIKVFVINGNHDVDVAGNGKRLSQTKFREIYENFGYGEATDTYEGTLSYTAELDEKHTIIAIDNIGYYRDDGTFKPEMDDEHRLWIYEKTDECVNSGKEPIIIAHKPFMNHFPDVAEAFSSKGHNNALLEYFAKKGVNLVFVGHMHFNDIKKKTYSSDETEYDVYEVMTSCLAMYNGTYHEVALGEKAISINSAEVKRVDKRYLPSFCPEEDVASLTEDFPEYARRQLYLYMDRMYCGIADEGGLLDIALPNDLSELEPVWEIVKNDVVKRCVKTPYYISDEKEGDTSLQRILESYGLTMPETEYGSFSDYANDALGETIDGDRDFTDENFAELFKYTIYEVVWMLDDASDEINALLEETGYEERLNIDCERLFCEGELELYDSGVMPFLVSAAKRALSGAPSIVINIIDSLGDDMNVLTNELVSSLAGGFTNGIVVGYEQYVGAKYIDLDGLLTEGVLGTYLADFIVAPQIKGNYALITK